MKFIKISEKLKEDTLKKFDEEVAEARNKLLASNRTTQAFEFKFTPPSDLTVPIEQKNNLPRPKILMSAATYLKMLQYVLKIDIECAWHGFVTKHANATYTIDDVKMYPHKGSAAFVESDDDKYPAWEAALTNEQYLARRFQAHSHVNMGVTPSGTDAQNQKDFMNDLINLIETNPEQIESFNPFYIFAIMNKKQEINWFLYDYSIGILFEKDDIDFTIYFSETETNLTLNEEIKEMHISKTTYTPTTGYGNYGYAGSHNQYNGWAGYNKSAYDIDDDEWGPRNVLPSTTPITSVSPSMIKKNQIWEIRCNSDAAQKEFLNCDFYKKNKHLLFAHNDTTLKIVFFYALDDEAAKKIDFDTFKTDPFYLKTANLTMSEIDRPKWYPPETNNKNTKKMDKILTRLEESIAKDETPYILIDTKTKAFETIHKKYDEMLDIIGNLTKITFKNGEVKTCFCITNIDFIEDIQLNCISALQAAGFALKSIKLEKKTDNLPS